MNLLVVIVDTDNDLVTCLPAVCEVLVFNPGTSHTADKHGLNFFGFTQYHESPL